ncbi:hypothetical protein IscW_ISCW009543, partial [Ixodes scapularis]
RDPEPRRAPDAKEKASNEKKKIMIRWREGKQEKRKVRRKRSHREREKKKKRRTPRSRKPE